MNRKPSYLPPAWVLGCAAALLSAACHSSHHAGTPVDRDVPAADAAPPGTAPDEDPKKSSSMSDGGVVAAPSTDALRLSFVTVGCNRLDKSDWDSAANPSSANLPQLEQTFADIAALAVRPQLFFFTGDLVLGLDQDTTRLEQQLAAWADTYRAGPLASAVPLVPLPGNHEMLYKSGKAELQNPGADAVWARWLSANHFGRYAGGGASRTPANEDALEDDQSSLSYAFDVQGVHFIVLNTDTWTSTPDPATGSTKIGWIPLAWLRQDLEAAQANPAVSAIFLLGHKPILPPTGGTTGEDAINPAQVAALEALIDQNGKVAGYLCAHAHEWNARRLPGTRGVWQIVAGNGGSPLESKWAAGSPFYGFTEVRVYQSGRVGVVSHQRPVPTPYDARGASPAVAADELTIVP